MDVFSNHRRLLAFAHDLFVAAMSFWLALYMRMGSSLEYLSKELAITAIILFASTCGLVFWARGLYRRIWVFASMRDLLEILRSTTVAVAAFLAIAFLTTRLDGIPRSVPFMAWFIMLSGLGGSRMLFRMLRERRLSLLWEKSGGGRVNALLVGTGDETDIFLRAIGANPQSPYHVVGIVGESAKRIGRMIHGVEIVGSIENLAEIVSKLRAQHSAPSRIILTRSVSRLNHETVSYILEQAASLGISVSRLPALTDLQDGTTTAIAVKDKPLALEDLLGRPETKLNRQEICALVKGKRVLVTGAGGTIGSELARQIAALNPAYIVLVEFCEFNLYRIDMELRETFPSLDIRSFIGDVRDMTRISQLFSQEKPELVFHAAAIKHVPIAEENIREALMTNVIGTRNIADCCMKTGTAEMVLISTDKAVYPSSVMGATKRLAEMYCQALDIASKTTRFITVRFGNVLGSTGSVVPRFQEQIAKGGPVTVTHPDITRYFMTVREAVELVLQASALGANPEDQRGKVLVLDMGQPVKIADLARQMIRLAGLRPEEDIKIEYVGLRPGEKLHEELFADAEELIPSAADGVKIGKATTDPLNLISDNLRAYETELRAGMQEELAKATLSKMVPEFSQLKQDIRKTG